MTAKEDDPMYFNIITLNSGLRIAYKRMPGNRFDAGIMFRVGHMDDPIGKEGLSHLLEHHVFTNIPDIPSQDATELSTWLRSHRLYRPAASTGLHTTFYRSFSLNDDAGTLMRVLLNMAFKATCSGNLEHDREIIRKEGSQRKQTKRADKILKEQNEALLGIGHRLITQTGCPADEILNALTIEDVKNHHRNFYFPGNASLVMIGDIDFVSMINFIRAVTEDIPAPSILPIKRPAAIPKVPQPPMCEYRLSKGVRSTTIEMSRILSLRSETYAHSITGAAIEDTLMEHLRESLKLVYSVRVSQAAPGKEWHIINIITTTAPDAASRVTEEIWNALQNKNKIRAKIHELLKTLPAEMALKDTTQSDKLGDAIDQLLFKQSIETLHELTEKYKAITQSEIDRVLDEMLDPQFFHTAIIENRS